MDAVAELPQPMSYAFLNRAHPLDCIFAPRSIAVVGASEKPSSVGRILLENIDAEAFRVVAVNPIYASINGKCAWPHVTDIPEQIDLAVIATPAETVPGIVRECVQAKVKGAVIISAGFRECGPAGADLERQITKLVQGKLRVIGPNCLGVMVPATKLNATFACKMALPGSVGFISQSGALGTAILDWSLRERVGFSAFVSAGSMLDVGWGDLIYYLGDDPHTKSIVIYMESVGDARAFLSAAREVALTKPIIVLKVGRTESASNVAASHTGAMTGSDEVFDAACRRVGVLRVRTIEELFDMAEVLCKQPRPKGPRLAIVTNAGGPGALATDMLICGGGKLAPISNDTFNSLNQALPPHWSRSNPIDILGDADPERYIQTVQLIRDEPNVDGTLVILTPQAMTDPTGVAEQLKSSASFDGKPLLACWMGGDAVAAGEAILNAANVCTFDYPDEAARAFDYMWHYSYNLQGIYETPSLEPISDEREAAKKDVRHLISAERKARRTILTEYESKTILKGYGIPTVETCVAFTKREAIRIARQLHYPVVLKLYSVTLTHKCGVGGVKLNLRDACDVYRAWDEIEASVSEKAGHQHFLGVTVQPMVQTEGMELIVGSSIDPQFGPVLLFGVGGRLAEVFKDRAVGLPPLNSTLARRMMEQTQIYEALKGIRGGPPVDLATLEQLLVRFSHLVLEQPWIREIDINPLLASPKQLLVLDARMILHEPEIKQLPRTAIRPYPTQYVLHWKLQTGAPITLRPIRPEDEPLLVKFHRTLSEQSVYYRYFTSLKLSERIAHERLSRICFNDYDREIALVADYENKKTGEHEILGVGRLSKIHGVNEAEFAIIVSDSWQNQGLGTEFLKLLVKVARDEKLDRISAHILADNHEMQRICAKQGFELHQEDLQTEYLAEMKL